MNEGKRRFSEVVGGLVSGVAYARSVADREAMRIANFYHQHELLKGMPIPRLRIHRMSISLPMVVSEVIPGSPAVRNPAVEIARLAAGELERAITEIREELRESQSLVNEGKAIWSDEEKDRIARFQKIIDLAFQLKIRDRFETSLSDDIERAYCDLNLREGSGPSDASLCETVGRVAEAVTRQIFTETVSAYVNQVVQANNDTLDHERGQKTIRGWMDHPMTIKAIGGIRNVAEENAILKRTEAPDFLVSVNTESVKNTGGGPDVVTRLDMVLREEGLEWHSEEKDGKTSSRLVPE
jgi:hypothetical protein